MLNQRTLFISFTALLLLSGCALLPGGQPASPLYENTQIYQTVAAQLTASAMPMMTSQPIASPSAGATAAPATPPSDRTPLPATASLPCNRAAAGRPVIDISIPDGSPMLPGQTFTKTWRLVNAGSCPWTRDYAVVWFSGETFGSTRTQALSSEVKPGQSLDISLDLLSPTAPGVYQSNWMLRNAAGQFFGLGPTSSAPFWVKIEVVVVRTASPAPAATPTPTATLQAISRGSVTLALDKKFDLDAGKIAADSSVDLALTAASVDGLQFTPLNGARFDPVGNVPPSITICKNTALKPDALNLTAEMTGLHLCYRTSQSLPGYLVLKSINLKDKTISIEFLTWAAP